MYIKSFLVGVIAISVIGIIASILSGYFILGYYLFPVLGLIVGIKQYKNIYKLNVKLESILTIPVLWVLFNTFFLKYQNIGILTRLRVSIGITLAWYLILRLVVFVVNLFKGRGTKEGER